MTNLYAKFTDYKLAERAIGALLDHGVAAKDISLVGPAGEHEYGLGQHGITTTTSGDAAVGAAKGAAVGLGVGALGALASLLIPGFGLVIGGGALATAAAAAAGTSVAGAVAGGVAGFLCDQGVDELAAQDYATAINEGGAVVEVSTPSGEVATEAIHHLLTKYGGERVSEISAIAG